MDFIDLVQEASKGDVCQIAWNRDPHFAPNLDPFVDRD